IGMLNAYQNTVAKAINALGQVAGHSFNRNDGRAFLYSNGGMASLGAFDNGLYSVANGLNDVGQVVGFASTGQGVRAFLYDKGGMSNLGTLSGDVASYAAAVNHVGQIVGYSTDALPVARAFLYQNGAMINLSELPEVRAAGWKLQTATAINN